MSTHFGLLGVLVLAAGFAWPAEGRQAASAPSQVEEFNRIVSLMEQGKQEAACAEAEKLAVAAPRFAPALNLLGICATRAGEMEKAEGFFLESIQADPQYTEPRSNLAANLLSRGKTREGLEELESVIRLDPDNLIARVNLGAVKLEERNFSEAVKHLGRAHHLRKEDPTVALAFARALLGTGRTEEARRLLEALVEGSYPLTVKLSAGLVFIEAGERALGKSALGRVISSEEKARDHLLQVVRDAVVLRRYYEADSILEALAGAAQTDAEWHALFGYVGYKLGESTRALAHLQKALELAPHIEDYYLNMAEFLLFHNSDSAAAAILRAGLERFPNSVRLHTSLTMAGLARGMDPQMAVRHAETALRIEPNYEPALSLLCLAHMKLKQWDRLQEAAMRLASVEANSPEGYYYLGVALSEVTGQEGEASEAYRLLEKAIQMRPDFSGAHFAIGKLLLKMRRIEESIASLRTANGLNPESSEIVFQLSRALQRNGKTDEAQRAMDEYRRLHRLELEKFGTSPFSVASPPQ